MSYLPCPTQKVGHASRASKVGHDPPCPTPFCKTVEIPCPKQDIEVGHGPRKNISYFACPTLDEVGHKVGHGSRAWKVGHRVLLDPMSYLQEAWKVGHGQSRAWSRNLIIINPFACSLLPRFPDHVLLLESRLAGDRPPKDFPLRTMSYSEGHRGPGK